MEQSICHSDPLLEDLSQTETYQNLAQRLTEGTKIHTDPVRIARPRERYLVKRGTKLYHGRWTNDIDDLTFLKGEHYVYFGLFPTISVAILVEKVAESFADNIITQKCG